MPRGKARVIIIVAAGALVAVAGVLVWTPGSTPSRPVVLWGRGDAITRDPDSTVYLAQAGILFDVDSSVVRPEAVPALKSVLADLQGSHADGTIWVEGYTDDVGSDAYNLALSGSRAQNVARWLVGEGGIDRSRIRVIAYGESSPAQPNDSEVHRRANRRVVIAVERAAGHQPSRPAAARAVRGSSAASANASSAATR